VRVRLVHGFSLTPPTWNAVEARLPPDWDVQALEVPDGLDFVATADALAHRGGLGTWVGYSMGARLSLRLALDHPARVERLVLMSGTAGIPSGAERRTRRAADAELAHEIERDGHAPFLERWLDHRLFETLPRQSAMLDERIRGNTIPRLVHQLRALGVGSQEPLWGRLPSLEMPVLLVTGQWDRAYTDLAQQMAAAIGDRATHVVIEKAGHALHLEQPDKVAHALTTWLDDGATA